ncbi:hypothetical protein K8R42_01610 [bacterium]|nr:hypothetical protein [bacterium]
MDSYLNTLIIASISEENEIIMAMSAIISGREMKFISKIIVKYAMPKNTQERKNRLSCFR